MKSKEIAPKPKRQAEKTAVRVRRQCGVIPMKIDAVGQLVILLVTSRETGRWVIPKGWTAAKLSDAKAAAREAFEEAGIVGRIFSKKPFGTYQYEKRLSPARTVTCEVSVFLFHVTEQLETWPEKEQRQISWFHLAEAAALVAEPELASMLLNLANAPGGIFVSDKRKKAGQPVAERTQ